MNKGDKNRTILILTIFTIIFTVLGSSLAYLNWQTATNQRTNVVFTATADFSCAADGGGNITSSEKTIAPASCLNTTYAIQRTVTVTPTIKTAGKTIYMDLWLDIIDLGDGLSASQNFKYALTTSGSSCTTSPLASGTFNGLTNNGRVELLSNQAYTSSDPVTYYLYIWLDAAETSTTTMNQTFNLSLGGSCTDKPAPYTDSVLNGADPQLATSMIPVTIANDGTVSTANTQEEWYNYTDKEWANAVLVKSTGTNSRTYYEEKVENNEVVTIPEDDILAYYVWIPKYSYKMNGTEESISISFNDTPSEYTAHPAFTFEDDQLGMWVGKFETAHSTLTSSSSSDNNNLNCTDENCANADGLIIKPNVSSLRRNTVSNFFYGARSMERSGNPYGLTSSEVDTHMMKNSEWGAVAYLSHSVYGINEEIYINNSSGYYTGRSSGAVGSSSTTRATYGTYNWLGAPVSTSNVAGTITDSTLGTMASTTGNVTGVYDMSGGAYEYVMGNYNGTTNSNFSTLPGTKYYDKYTVTSASSCTTAMCGGHALNETSGWYSDNASFVYSSLPWFVRGNGYGGGASAGAFGFDSSSGGVSSSYGFRSVLVANGA